MNETVDRTPALLWYDWQKLRDRWISSRDRHMPAETLVIQLSENRAANFIAMRSSHFQVEFILPVFMNWLCLGKFMGCKALEYCQVMTSGWTVHVDCSRIVDFKWTIVCNHLLEHLNSLWDCQANMGHSSTGISSNILVNKKSTSAFESWEIHMNDKFTWKSHGDLSKTIHWLVNVNILKSTYPLIWLLWYG